LEGRAEVYDKVLVNMTVAANMQCRLTNSQWYLVNANPTNPNSNRKC